jgi:hypothetical protein
MAHSSDPTSVDEVRAKKGWGKIVRTSAQAAKGNFTYCWIVTRCIDNIALIDNAIRNRGSCQKRWVSRFPLRDDGKVVTITSILGLPVTSYNYQQRYQ